MQQYHAAGRSGLLLEKNSCHLTSRKQQIGSPQSQTCKFESPWTTNVHLGHTVQILIFPNSNIKSNKLLRCFRTNITACVLKIPNKEFSKDSTTLTVLPVDCEMKHTCLPFTTLSYASVVREGWQSRIKASTLICLDCVHFNKYGLRSQKI